MGVSRSVRVYYQIGAGNLYRVTRDNTIWPDPVRGLGAFYLPHGGNRYNAVHQVTVSCSEDPWVAICEAAYYQALKLRDAIASSLINALTYPFRSEHQFWGFQINPPPPVVDLEDPVAVVLFQYSPHVLTNPGQNYLATQFVSNAVRTHTPPIGSPDPLPEGILAPSVRTPRSGVYQPKQLALFVINRPGLLPYDQRSNLTANMRLEIEFLAASPAGGAVTFQTPAINWTKPMCRLSAIMGEPWVGPVPALAGRPGGRPIPLNRWLSLNICY
jgi:hypothetical protein